MIAFKPRRGDILVATSQFLFEKLRLGGRHLLMENYQSEKNVAPLGLSLQYRIAFYQNAGSLGLD
ncbi:MAG: hypothetical protein WDM90_17350 [Ferruginibacter sp.]